MKLPLIYSLSCLLVLLWPAKVILAGEYSFNHHDTAVTGFTLPLEDQDTAIVFLKDFSADIKIKTELSRTAKQQMFNSDLLWGVSIAAVLLLMLVVAWALVMRSNRLKLQRQEKKFRDLFEMSQDGVILRRLDADVFYDCNQAMLDMLGFKDKEAFLQLGPTGIVFAKQPDGQKIEDLLKKSNQVIQEKKKNRFEGLFKRKDGTPLYAEVVACLVDIDGQPTIQSVVRDMSHRKKMEDELRQLSSAVEASSAAILITDCDGNIEYINPKFTELTGYSITDVEGLNPRFLQSGEHDKAYYQGLWQTILKGEEWHGVFLNKKKNGEKYWVNASISSVIGENGEITHFVGVQDDITHMKELEEELLEAKVAADEANKAKGDFLARMSHEIRTPMNAIIGMNHLALLTELSAKQRDYIEKAHGAAQSLLGIINDILDFSKIEAGKLEFEEIEFNLDELFDRLASVVTLAAAEKKLEILFHISAESPRYLIGDPLRLQQVLTNLVNNAVKFTERGEIVVSVEQRGQSETETELFFSVKDTGIGLSEQQQQKLFQSFSQADGSTTRKYGGTGLGLVICKRLIELMGGEIGVESSLGDGSDFYFSARFGISAGAEEKAISLPDEIKGKKVLVVDDSGVARRVLAKGLEQLSLQVESAVSGEEALKAIESGRTFDLILMDWDMPGINGIDAAGRILAMDSHRNANIIMVTAYGREDIAEKAKKAGIRDFLVKPVSRMVLAEAVKLSFGYSTGSKRSVGGESSLQRTRPIWGAKILLVEDNDLNVQVATELLQEVKLQVSHAADGKQAVDMVDKADFDLVLMDIQMPVMDGLEATRRIRETNSELPIIAMTASAMAGDREKSEKVGMNDHIAKPIDPENLYTAMLKWITHGGRSVSESRREEDESDKPNVLTIKGIDTGAGLRRMGGKKKLYLDLLHSFSDRYCSTAEELAALVGSSDYDEAERCIHTFKGLCGSIGALELQEDAVNLEQLLKERRKSEFESFNIYFSEKLAVLVDSIKKSLEVNSISGAKDSGSLRELGLIIEELAPFIEKRRPMQCSEILEKIAGRSWPDQVNISVENLVAQIKKYRYKQALHLAREIVEMCGK